MSVGIPEYVAAVVVQVLVHLLLGSHKMIAVGHAMESQLFTEPGQFDHLVHLHKGQGLPELHACFLI